MGSLSLQVEWAWSIGAGLVVLTTSSHPGMPELESLWLICNFIPMLLLLRLEQSKQSSQSVLKWKIKHTQNTYELQVHTSTEHHEAARITGTMEDSATGSHASVPPKLTCLLADDTNVKEA